MKLLNQSLLYLSIAFFIIIGIWSVAFYYNLKDEIRDSIDDGLENSKILIVQKAQTDSTLLKQNNFGGNNFEIHPISKEVALTITDTYKDTLMYRVNEDDLEPVRILHTAFVNNENYYHLKVIASLVEEDDLVEEAFWGVVWLFIIIVLSTIIINNIVLHEMWYPFYEVVNKLKTYSIGDDDDNIVIDTKIKEFKELQQASNSLIKHVREAYKTQREFTENASHELQTPLAILINKLEMLLESKELVEKDAVVVDKVIEIAEKMKHLNKSLLLLAKIENKQFYNQQDLSINELIEDTLKEYDDYIQFKNIDVEFKAESEDLFIKIDAHLAQILISNLIRNAVFHNKSEGTITITLFSQKLFICNTGTTTPYDGQSIFERFNKESNSKHSTGLGLAICKAICELYNLPITYKFLDKKHCFCIDFNKIKLN